MSALDPDSQDAHDMSRLANGHDAALNALMERHAQKLFHYLVRALQDEQDAADLAQETFVRIYHHRARFDPGQKFTTWLYTIASNLVKDRYRWRSRHPQASLDAENQDSGSLKEHLPEFRPGPDESLEKAETAITIRNAVASLPEELRQPLILSLYEEMPQAEIAVILNCSVKAVEMRLYRARQQLRVALSSLLASG